MNAATKLAALHTLYRLASDDNPADLALVADALGLSCADADSLLEELESAGLVDAERVRLTMIGLTVAVSHGRAQARRPDTTRAA